MNRNTIKYIAIIAMLMDHIAIAFLPSNTIFYFFMRFIGRITAPVMCYFLVEGYRYTSSKYKYASRLLIFGIISQIPYALAFHNKILVLDFNMIITLFICFLVLYVYDNVYEDRLKWFIMFCLIMLTLFCDWNYFAPIFVLIFYIYQYDKKQQCIAFFIIALIAVSISCLLYKEYWQLGLLLVPIFILVYNGKEGVKTIFNKWFFYIFYPLHLFIIWLININTLKII